MPCPEECLDSRRPISAPSLTSGEESQLFTRRDHSYPVHRLIPPRPFLDTILGRVAIIWLVLRLAVASAGAAEGTSFAQGLSVPILGVAWTWLAVLVALQVDLSRRNESVFLANLGHSLPQISILAIAECVALEIVVRVIFV